MLRFFKDRFTHIRYWLMSVAVMLRGKRPFKQSIILLGAICIAVAVLIVVGFFVITIGSIFGSMIFDMAGYHMWMMSEPFIFRVTVVPFVGWTAILFIWGSLTDMYPTLMQWLRQTDYEG